MAASHRWWVVILLKPAIKYGRITVPFDKLVNVIYIINGYVGFVLLLFMVAHTIKRKRAPQNQRSVANS